MNIGKRKWMDVYPSSLLAAPETKGIQLDESDRDCYSNEGA
jgi:hypothetical protein